MPQDVVMVADLPHVVTKSLFIGVTGELFEEAHKIMKARIRPSCHQHVEVVRHETVGVKNKGLSSASANERCLN